MFYIDKSTAKHLYVKVGRSDNPIRRTKEWKNQCPSNDILLCGVWPKRSGAGEKLAIKKPDWGVPCQYYGRLESKCPHANTQRSNWIFLAELISIELSDIARRSPHIQNGHTLSPAVLESTIKCSNCKLLTILTMNRS